jgi:hypothetical protein
LLRVMRRYNELQAARMHNLLKPFRSLFAKPFLSYSTVDLLRKNLVLSDQLQDSLATFRRASRFGSDEPIFKRESLPLPEIPINPAFETNRRLGDLLDYLDRMKPLVVECGELIRNLNDAAIQMLADFGRSTRRADTSNKIIIAFAAASLLVTAVFSVWSFYDSRAQDDRTEALLRALLQDAQSQREEQTKAVTALIGSLRAEITSLDNGSRQAQANLEALIAALTQAVKEMQDDDGAPPSNAPPQ